MKILLDSELYPLQVRISNMISDNGNEKHFSAKIILNAIQSLDKSTPGKKT